MIRLLYALLSVASDGGGIIIDAASNIETALIANGDAENFPAVSNQSRY